MFQTCSSLNGHLNDSQKSLFFKPLLELRAKSPVFRFPINYEAKFLIKWGSEIWPFQIQNDLKSGLFEGQISNDPVFKWLSFSYRYS